jgi:hypothetical protein
MWRLAYTIIILHLHTNPGQPTTPIVSVSFPTPPIFQSRAKEPYTMHDPCKELYTMPTSLSAPLTHSSPIAIRNCIEHVAVTTALSLSCSHSSPRKHVVNDLIIDEGDGIAERCDRLHHMCYSGYGPCRVRPQRRRQAAACRHDRGYLYGHADSGRLAGELALF